MNQDKHPTNFLTSMTNFTPWRHLATNRFHSELEKGSSSCQTVNKSVSSLKLVVQPSTTWFTGEKRMDAEKKGMMTA